MKGYSDLIKRSKPELTEMVRKLYPVNGKKWPALLREYDEWYSSASGVHAWNNSLHGGRASKDIMRKLIFDMSSILNKTSSEKYRAAKRAKEVVKKVRKKVKKSLSTIPSRGDS